MAVRKTHGQVKISGDGSLAFKENDVHLRPSVQRALRRLIFNMGVGESEKQCVPAFGVGFRFRWLD
jgi:hypothetical protein